MGFIPYSDETSGIISGVSTAVATSFIDADRVILGLQTGNVVLNDDTPFYPIIFHPAGAGGYKQNGSSENSSVIFNPDYGAPQSFFSFC